MDGTEGDLSMAEQWKEKYYSCASCEKIVNIVNINVRGRLLFQPV